MSDEPTWTPVPRTRTHQMVVEAIENQILSGALHVGDLLPAERTLSDQLQVSRAAVREAIRVLEGQGVLESNVGSGHRAGTFIAAMPSVALTRFLRLHVALSNFGLEEVVQTRTILEVESARLAAAEQDGDAAAGMRDALADMSRRGVTRDEFNDADTRFHIALAHGSGNRLFADMTQAIRESLKLPILRGLRGHDDWESVADVLRGQHAAILAAVEDGDADRAAAATAEHISTAYRALLG
ncbi:FCD domain-containing protein [Corynebacterium sp. USCH3]|uniref:FadR/GntR family transcriptional regulator n=1 Tax=Corynebacterium sp. USCH3 TaxID=3024840 RepID=UPI0030A252CC